MNEVTLFSSNKNSNAQVNLDEFIHHAKKNLTVFGRDLDFDSNLWDITQYLCLKAKNSKTRLLFGNHDSEGAFKDPFLSFSKAYIRYKFGLTPLKAIAQRLLVLRCVYQALTEGGVVSPIYISSDIANRASQLLAQRYSIGPAYRLGIQLADLVGFLASNDILLFPFQWNSPAVRPQDTQRIGEEADRFRESKMPSEAALDALPHIFRLAERDIHRIVSSTTAILLSAPDRINEVLRLPLDCEVHRKNKEGKAVYGLRWPSSKGANPMIKDVIGSMAEVVQEAIGKIKEETQMARDIAKWYEDNPNQVYLHADVLHLRNRDWLTIQEACDILFGVGRRVSTNSINNLLQKKVGKKKYIEFKSLQSWVISQLPKNFPIFDVYTGLKYSEALYVSLRNQFRSSKATYKCLIELIDGNKINCYLGDKSDRGIVSIFEAFEFKEPDGSPIVVRTHQFRHYLNTLALAGGMNVLEVSKWSGRKDIKQTATYDHRTSAEVVQQIRNAVGNPGKSYGPISRLGQSTLIKRNDIAKLVVETAHTTDIGYCLHNFVAAPCQLHLDCINCQEMVCIKGDVHAEKNLKIRLDESIELLKVAQNAMMDGDFGADRWYQHQKEVNERYMQLNEILSRPTIPAGTVIQLAKPTSIIQSEKLKLEGKK